MSRLRLAVAARCGAVLTVLVAAMLGGCGDNLTVAEDAGVPPQADAATAEAGGPWNVPWQAISETGDPQGDCTANDPGCTADAAQLSYAVVSGDLLVDVRFWAPFPFDTGSFELFMIPPNVLVVGHSVQSILGQFVYWNADCSTAAPSGLRHAGCHWTSASMPDWITWEWLDPQRLVFRMPLADLGFADQTELGLAVGMAPFAIAKTAEYTDRFPDTLWVTSTEIQGCAKVPLAPGS